MNRFVLSVFFVPLWLSGAAIRRRRGTWLFMTSGLIVVALLMLGPQTPAYRVYYELPLVDLFRGPIRLAFLQAFTGAILLAIGIEAVARWLRNRGGRPRAVFCVALALAVAVVGDFYRRTPVVAMLPYLEAHDRKRGAPDAVTEFFREHRLEGRVFPATRRLHGGSYVEKMGMMNGFDVALDYEPSLPAAYRELFRVRGSDPWHGAMTVVEEVKRRAGPLVEPRILDLISARWYLAETTRPKQLLERIAEAAGGRSIRLGPVVAYERPDALPRAYAVRRILAEPDLRRSASRIRAADFRPRREAVITSPAAATLEALASSNATPATSRDAVQLISHEARRVVVQAHCDAHCLLVLTDLHHPDWTARVDGTEAHVERVNVAFRGVPLEPGRHEVVFRYEPTSFLLGLFGLAAALCGMLGIAAHVGRRASRRDGETLVQSEQPLEQTALCPADRPSP